MIGPLHLPSVRITSVHHCALLTGYVFNELELECVNSEESKEKKTDLLMQTHPNNQEEETPTALSTALSGLFP